MYAPESKLVPYGLTSEKRQCKPPSIWRLFNLRNKLKCLESVSSFAFFEGGRRLIQGSHLLFQVVCRVWVQGDFDSIVDLRLHDDNANVEVQVE